MKKILLIIFIVVLIVVSFHFLILKGKKVISIAYTTDLQGFITPHEYIWFKGNPLMGGSAYLATYIKKERRIAKKENRSFLFVDTGNFFAGQAEGYFLKGSSIIEIMNELGYDAMAIGPKDFAFGEENLRNLAKEAKFPFLSANITKEDTGEVVDFVTPYIIKEYKGVKIGIIGITSPLIFSENIKNIRILDPILTIRKYISLLKNAEVNLIVVLSNLGLEEDKELAQEVRNINIIIGGNGRESYRTAYIEPKNKTIIAETEPKGISCTSLNLILNNKGKIIRFKFKFKDLLITKFKPDLQIQSIVQKYVEIVKEKKEEIIGYAETELTRVKDRNSGLGNWMADILRKKTKADIALVADLQADLKQGEITLGDVYNVLPIIEELDIVGFNLAVLEMTGEQIGEILEAGVSYSLEKGKGIVQVSGLKYIYDLKRKKWDRIIDITVNSQQLGLSKKYKVAVNGYLAAGLGGYYMIKDIKNRCDTGLMDFYVVAEYIKTHSPITAPALEGRIVRIE